MHQNQSIPTNPQPQFTSQPFNGHVNMSIPPVPSFYPYSGLYPSQGYFPHTNQYQPMTSYPFNACHGQYPFMHGHLPVNCQPFLYGNHAHNCYNPCPTNYPFVQETCCQTVKQPVCCSTKENKCHCQGKHVDDCSQFISANHWLTLQIKYLEIELAKLADMIKKLQEKNEDLEKLLKKTMKEKEDLEELLKKIMKEKNALEEENEELKKKLKKLQEELEEERSKTKDCSAVEKLLKEAQDTSIEYAKKLDELKTQINMVKGEDDVLKKIKKDIEDKKFTAPTKF